MGFQTQVVFTIKYNLMNRLKVQHNLNFIHMSGQAYIWTRKLCPFFAVQVFYNIFISDQLFWFPFPSNPPPHSATTLKNSANAPARRGIYKESNTNAIIIHVCSVNWQNKKNKNFHLSFTSLHVTWLWPHFLFPVPFVNFLAHIYEPRR